MRSSYRTQTEVSRHHPAFAAVMDDHNMVDANKTTPALILGSYITSLGTIRSLAAAGIESWCLTPQDNFVRCSRWYRPQPAGVAPVIAVEDLPAYLEQLPIDQGVLIPCSDEWVAAVANLGPDLAARFRSSQPSQKTLNYFLDKGILEGILSANNIPRPSTFLLNTEADLRAIEWDQFEHLFLKPRCSRPFFLRYGVKAVQVRSVEDAFNRLARCQEAGFAMMIQEYISGPADRHYFIDGFVDRHGEIRAIFARQRIRMYPLDFGDSSYMTTVPLEAAGQAIDSLKTLLPAVDYRGIFSAEFKKDARDEAFKLIEVNTRPWTYIGFDTIHGMNMAEMAYRDALDLDVPTVTDYDIGASMVYLPNDLRACWSLFRRGDIGLCKWSSSWLSARSAVFSLRDPMPSTRWWWNVIRSRLGFRA